MVGPQYARPAAPLSPKFKEAQGASEGAGWKIAQPRDDLLRGEWWELYGDARLDELEEQVEGGRTYLHGDGLI
jgi:outer membrane protein TolC